MSSLSSINAANFSRINATGVVGKIGPQTLVTPGSAPTSIDQVTLSAEALAASEDAGQSSRADRLAQIRAEIQAGTYDTDDKLTIVADRIARKLG